MEALENRWLLTNFLVNTTADVAGDGMLSLQEAITAANSNTASADAVAGEADGDRITFDASIANSTILVGGTELSITEDLVIDGTTQNITIDADNSSRVFLIGTAEVVTIANLELTQGDAGVSVGGAVAITGGGTVNLDGIEINSSTAAEGGAVSNFNADVTITNSLLTNNTATVNGGALFSQTGSASTTVSNTTISDNTAEGDAAAQGGGGIFVGGGSMTVDSGSTISGNIANGTAGSGGGIFVGSGATLNVEDSTISANIANRAGGGIEDASGAGLDVTLNNVALDANIAGQAGSAAPGNGGGLHVTGAGDVNIVGGTVNANFAAAEGGGLWNGSGTMTILGTEIDANASAGNAADEGGGGIFNAGGTVEIDNATITANLAAGATTVGLDGSQEVPPVTTSASGEAIFQFNAEAGTFRMDLFVEGIALADLTASPVHIHAAPAGANGPVIVDFDALGFTFVEVDGGIRLLAEDVTFPPANIADLAAGNTYINVHTTAEMSGEIRGQLTIPSTLGSGGGILNAGGTIEVNDSSISGNIASRAGGGIETNGDGSVELTTVALNDNVAGSAGFATPGNGGGLHVTGGGTVTVSAGTVNNNSAELEGGGLWNGTGTMTVIGTQIDGNTAAGANADNGGGGIFNAGGTLNVQGGTVISNNTASGTAGSGGGIFNDAGGTLTVNVAEISGNTANRAGGGIEDNSGAGLGVTITAAQISNNNAGVAPAIASPGNGGGVHVTGAGDVNISSSFVLNNEAALEGGGLWNGTGTMTVVDTVIDGNTAAGVAADNGGGGIFNAGGTLDIETTTITNNDATGTLGSGGGIFNDVGGTLTITSSAIEDNEAVRAGGGIEDNSGAGLGVTLTNVILSDNEVNGPPGNGGGLHVTGAGDVTITGGVVTDNEAALEGGGLWNGTGTMTITNATISGNTAAGAAADDGGGGIFNNGGTLLVSGSTLEGNSATGTNAGGGGIFNFADGTVSVENSTISNNDAAFGAGVFNAEAGDVQTFTVDLQTLNAAFGSNATGTATITLDQSGVSGSTSGTATIRVEIDAEGLQDLSSFSGAIHVAHIHGQFASNANRPLAAQGDGPFFDGEGGAANGAAPVNSVLPSTADDGDLNIDETALFATAEDYLDFFEGRPDYGPVVLNLTQNQLDHAPDGTPPLTFFFQEAGAGNVNPAAEFPNGTEFNLDTTYTFDLSDPNARRQFNNITPLNLREIVLHGLTIPTEISDAIDEATGAAPGSPTAGIDVGGGMTFRATAPVAAGEIVASSANVTITNSTIANNEASVEGGGLWNGTGTMTIANSNITGNTASGTGDNGNVGGGGGLFNAGGTVEISATAITNNEADGNGGAGGGIYNDTNGNVAIAATLVANNESDGNGGGVFNDGKFTFDTASSITQNTANAGSGIFTGANGTLCFDDITVVSNNAGGDFDLDASAVVDLSGHWIINAEGAQVLQLDEAIRFINEFGDSSAAFFITPTQVVATDWGNLLGSAVGNQIQWNNATEWTELPDLEKTFTINGTDPTLVEQLGTELLFTNEFGSMSTGRFTSATEVIADAWGNLTATVVNGNLEFANNTTWTAQADPANGEPANLSGAWATDGGGTKILQFDDQLLLIDELGAVSQGTLDGPFALTATDFGITGTIDPDSRSIEFSDGTTWNRVPVLDRNENWNFGPTNPTAVSQIGTRFVFTNEHGDRSEGAFEPGTGLVATDWGITGMLNFTTGEIDWSNGTTWDNSDFGAFDEVFSDVNDYPWIV